ncbi:Two-component sensor histidine kinase, contains HisKA and HATPase domains [Devosia enhydra]|uniref:histidine kinase n=1 Tax=Devosia enhydra TaxID=665118 RepID=A0A1K2HW98_9HYPH|nr:CHASE3 domain-containing protein [Devosia enhydra]SFZ83254.1 Two-component sensor histidine kinase, contains HisKA and HATPase domains [Devosia enhydra]
MTDATADSTLSAPPRRGRRRRIAIALALTFVLLAAGASLFLVRGVETQIDDIAVASDVRRYAHELIIALVDAETGQRGYLLTQDRQYLEPYGAAVASIDNTYQTLLSLLPAETEQRARISGLEGSISAKREEMARTISLAGTGRLNEALDIIRSDAGRTLMEDMRRTLRSFIVEEDARLLERNAAVQAYRQWLVVAILAALAGAAALAYVLFWRTQKQVTVLSRTSQELIEQNEELEAHVRARTADAVEAREHAERERARVEALLQDTNHRIGNSLATVSSLLALQMQRSKSAEVKRALESAQQRVHAIASGHRRLRLGSDMETARLDEFLEAVIEDIKGNQAKAGQVSFERDFDPLTINARDATTLGIMVGELITNALKHAFPGDRKGTIRIGMKREADGVVVLSVADDGVGLSAEPHHENGLGSLIVKQLARQFGGEPHLSASTAGGAQVRVTLPELHVAEADA